MLGDATVLFIIGNKIDMENHRNVTQEEAKEYVKILTFINQV